MDKTILLAYQPDYYKDSKVMDNINNANAIELNKINTTATSILNQVFVDTASFSLERWENEWGIKLSANDDISYRRSRIIAKKKGQGTFTVSFVKNIAESFENGDVIVIENNSSLYFTIKFVGKKGIPPNLQDLKNVMEELKPAHLGVIYEFTYLTWDEHDNYNKTWNQWDALNLTWDAFETYKE